MRGARAVGVLAGCSAYDHHWELLAVSAHVQLLVELLAVPKAKSNSSLPWSPILNAFSHLLRRLQTAAVGVDIQCPRFAGFGNHLHCVQLVKVQVSLAT